MKDLIEVLKILLEYANDDRRPTHCEHDTLYICSGIQKEQVSEADIARLDELGVFWDEEFDCFMSFRFGSC